MAPRTEQSVLKEWAERIGELVTAGHTPPGGVGQKGDISSVNVLAQELGISQRQARTHVKNMTKTGLDSIWTGAGPVSETLAAPAIPKTPIEVHNEDFWRKRSKDLLKKLGQSEHLIEEMLGIRNVPYSVPNWIKPKDDGKRGRSVIGCLVSDVHDGEVISAEEINGINAYDPDICNIRMQRYYSAACTIGERWASDTDCDGAFVALAGDLISGDIHEELRITNAMTSHESVQHAVETHSAGIKMLLNQFGKVHTVVVPGNHGRTTIKSTAKLYAKLSYDNLIGTILMREFESNPNVTFQISAAKDQLTPIYGRTVLTTHGDKIGTRGGMGFAGPMLPIVRGSKKMEAQQAGIGRRPDLMQFGHYHTTGNPGMILANGSVVGYSEYADDIRAVVEPPQQWLYLLHSRWWLRERMPVQLVDPGIPEKPRVNVPAGWSEA